MNTLINVLAWDGMRRSLATSPSLLMQGQLRARVVKLVSSLFVQVTMTVAAVATDEAVVVWADAVGSTFVAFVMFVNGIKMLRESLPDLLDQSAGTEVRDAIERVLAGHAVDAAAIGRVRTRRSGQRLFVDIAMGFDGTASIAEVDRRIEAIKAAVRQELADAEVSIQASPL